MNPPQAGECRVFNQFTEIFSIAELAGLVKRQGEKIGLEVQVQHLENPRVEAAEHYYYARHQKLTELGLKPHLLSDVLIDSMLARIRENASRIRAESILPQVRWNPPSVFSTAEDAAGGLLAPDGANSDAGSQAAVEQANAAKR